MPRIHVNLQALAHNANLTRDWANGHGVSISPVLKAVKENALIVKFLASREFLNFGVADPNILNPAPGLFRRSSVALTPKSLAHLVAQNFEISFESELSTILALDDACLALGRKMDIILMVNLGDHREGMELSEIDGAINHLSLLKNLNFRGFGSTLSCLSHNIPGPELFDKLGYLVTLSFKHGLNHPIISLGGTVMASFVENYGRGPITELRMGDPFLFGWDLYRNAPLPGGIYRQDVFALAGEILEIRERLVSGHYHKRALIELGRFQSGVSLVPGDQSCLNHCLEKLNCLWPGSEIVGMTAGYLIVDVTNSPQNLHVGQELLFRPGYWALSQAFLADFDLVIINSSQSLSVSSKDFSTYLSKQSYIGATSLSRQSLCF
ncbi:MAG: alanine racemase [Deltaproteobacteria bacterium]|jgi:predicted amino acid racemase|nr:alanine racemase [Deltaproteobacteria bacterium]